MPGEQRPYLQLDITARQNVTVMPRILQVLSRRGVILHGLHTKKLDNHTVLLHCILETPVAWQHSLPSLLVRLVDVQSVQIVRADDHE